MSTCFCQEALLLRAFRPIFIAFLIAGLGACAGTGAQFCASGMGPPVLVFNLFFGKAIPGRGDLTAKEWLQFLDDTVTANLPNGYTVVDADGAWMNPITRKTIKEGTKLMLVALPVTPGSFASINRIRNEYQVRFQQQLVGMTVQQGCGAF
jgi:Protein of unknown function (DUF3574)